MKKGDLVRFESKDYFSDDALPVAVWKTGVIVDMSESTDIFSEKFAIIETTTNIQILSEGKLHSIELDGTVGDDDWSYPVIEVIHEDQ